MTQTMTPEMAAALLSAQPRQGAVPTAATPAVLGQLMTAGLVAKGGGLTRRGVTARTRAMDAALDGGFGPEGDL